MDIIAQLKRDEQLRLKPYRDTSDNVGFEGKKGQLTIGWGANIEEIDQDEATFLLLHRYVNRAQVPLREKLPWTQSLDPIRLAALENICYNIGIHSLLTFKNALSLAEHGHYAAAAAAFLDSKWEKQVGARAHRIAKQFEQGVWV